VKTLINNISQNLKSKFYFDYDTSQHVWFRAGGKTAVYCLVYDEKELEIIINSISKIPYEIIGAGSNFLIRDCGFNGILFKLGKNFNKIILHEKFIEVGSSILDLNLSKFAQKNNIRDFEFYSGIPGTIGGAVKMNAGCYGKETKDILQSIKYIDQEGCLKKLDKVELNLKYRNSSLPENSIIISANYDSVTGNTEEITNKILNIKEKRNNSQPLRAKTSGSTFKNPLNYHAAKLIEQANCKGLNIGDVYVSNKHANFLINTNNASASEIEDLGNKIIDKVYNKFGIKLEWEIKILGN
jgi:UDP-N-acetylmuramate dehydrogenase